MRASTAVLLVLLLAATLFLIFSSPAFAREIIGCNGIIKWPCPGPPL